MTANIALSKIVSGKLNPRKVKPDRDAHRRMVATVKAFGIIEPLVVRPIRNKLYEVIAGKRRFAALKEVHRGNLHDVKVECQVRNADETTAEAIALAENFAREGMHPLDEAEAFARLAGEEGKDAKAIAAQFGVGDHYVRQRMKMATLTPDIKMAYREGMIDTGTAEVFTAIPEDRQIVVWKELNGHPRHADQVRNIINASWIDASHALFDLATLPPPAISRDLFSERVLVERSVFLEAQNAAVAKERDALVEDGWKEVIAGSQADVQDRLWSMAEAEVELDDATAKRLKEIDKRWEKLEAKIGDIPEEEDEETASQLQEQLDELEGEAEQIRVKAPQKFSEGTKAKGSVFLMLDTEGRVRRAYRVPKRSEAAKREGNASAEGVSDASPEALPTSQELSDRQLATTFTHQAIAVRQAVLKNRIVRKRLLVMILHERIRSEALAIQHDANGTTVHADNSEGFDSPALAALRKRRGEIDPFVKENFVEDMVAYKRLCKLSESQLDGLIELLTVESLTAHMVRPTQLIQHLAAELKVSLRDFWRPDTAWLASYQKVQLAHLTVELRGAVNRPSDDRKKSNLVVTLAQLFTDAAEGKLDEKSLAETVNCWLPSNMRTVPPKKG